MNKQIVAVLLILGCQNLIAQDAVRQELSTAFSDYSREMVVEKIFVHIDKPSYTVGEIIWFKAYFTNADNKPMDLSKILYAELLDDSNRPVLRAEVRLDSASGKGSFHLPFDLPSGHYTFRAYTNWMKNFGVQSFYHQPLLIVNPLSSAPAVTEAAEDTARYDVQFFPEGGDMVNTLKSKVGVKLLGPDGWSRAFAGSIIDDLNDTVASFTSGRAGLGQFGLTPLPGRSYRAALITENGEKIESVLPGAMTSGYTMSLSERASELRIEVSSTDDQVDKPVYLLAHGLQRMYKIEGLVVRSVSTIFSIEKSILNDGITYFTLLDGSKQAIAERLYFRKPSQMLNIKGQTLGSSFATRSEVVVEIGTTGSKGAVPEADLSMAVYRVDSLSWTAAPSILSSLWLTNELNGFVEFPEYYFSDDPELGLNTENLLLTHGWRRFNWNLISSPGERIKYMPELEGRIISGTVTNKSTRRPVSNVQLYVSPIGNRSNFGITRSGPEGRFNAFVRKFYGQRGVVVETTDKNDTIQIDIDDPYFPSYARSFVPRAALGRKDSAIILENGISSQAQNIFLYDSIESFVPDRDSIYFYGRPDASYMLDSYTRFNTMEEVMREYVAGVSLRKQRGQFHFRINNHSRSKFFGNDPLVLLDGVPVFDVHRVVTHDPLKIRKIEVMHSRYLMNEMVFDGILSFSSYGNDLGEFQLGPDALIINYDGLQMKREFYTPKYGVQAQRNNRIPDFRTQLIWKDQLTPISGGALTTRFYTSDVKGKFIGIIQGISRDGLAGSTSFSFEVK